MKFLLLQEFKMSRVTIMEIRKVYIFIHIYRTISLIFCVQNQ